MPTRVELTNLLAHPNESLTLEYKSWLALSENPGRATLAKAAIALANHGGGIIVLGMRENNVEGGGLVSQPRPDALRRYDQDDVNAAINRYADPAFHCELAFTVHPETNTEHAFVIVPGGMLVPVMSTRDCQGVIAAQRCYIRKPGPRSEEPFTADEWRSLFERCVKAGRDNMLDAIRLIVQGHAGGAPAAGVEAALLAFIADAQNRWQALVDPLAVGDPARMRHGHYEIGFDILDVPSAPSLVELRGRVDAAGAIKHTGWSPFVSLHRAPFEPRPVDGLIETWLGPPEEDRQLRDPAHCDFWRAHPGGRLFQQRGYDEDAAADRVLPGTSFDVTLPIWRVGEAMLFAARLSRLFGENPSILARCRYTGLRNRALISLDRRRHMHEDRVCADDEATIGTQATAAEIDDNLAEVMHPFLVPLYERFSFFELPMNMVVEELEALRQGRF